MKRKRVDEKRSHALIVTLLSNIPTAWLIKERLLSMLGNVSLGQVQNTKKRKLQQQQQQQKANSSNDKIRTTAWSFFVPLLFDGLVTKHTTVNKLITCYCFSLNSICICCGEIQTNPSQTILPLAFFLIQSGTSPLVEQARELLQLQNRSKIRDMRKRKLTKVTERYLGKCMSGEGLNWISSTHLPSSIMILSKNQAVSLYTSGSSTIECEESVI